MRAIFFCACVAVLSLPAHADEDGVPPRSHSSDYPVNARAKGAVIAAAILPPAEVSRIFSKEIDKHYIVVEVAIYPEQGASFDVSASDFTLEVGRLSAPAQRPNRMTAWPENPELPSRGTEVVTESGVVYQRGAVRNGETQQSVATYSGVAVTNDPGEKPSSSSGPDPRRVYDRLDRRAMPEGETRTVIAGYLYFPKPAKMSKADPLELKYAREDRQLSLPFPKSAR